MSAHTKGSWAVSKTVRHDERVEVRREPLGLRVAVVESAREAHLIAAAPDLLEALKRIITEATGHTLVSLDQAQAAIAKAEGRS